MDKRNPTKPFRCIDYFPYLWATTFLHEKKLVQGHLFCNESFVFHTELEVGNVYFFPIEVLIGQWGQLVFRAQGVAYSEILLSRLRLPPPPLLELPLSPAVQTLVSKC